MGMSYEKCPYIKECKNYEKNNIYILTDEEICDISSRHNKTNENGSICRIFLKIQRDKLEKKKKILSILLDD